MLYTVVCNQLHNSYNELVNEEVEQFLWMGLKRVNQVLQVQLQLLPSRLQKLLTGVAKSFLRGEQVASQ